MDVTVSGLQMRENSISVLFLRTCLLSLWAVARHCQLPETLSLQNGPEDIRELAADLDTVRASPVSKKLEAKWEQVRSQRLDADLHQATFQAGFDC